jgi:hypothetical protein
MKYKLLKELPDVEIGSIGFEEGGYVKFKNERNEYTYYHLYFIQSKSDWFEKVKEYDFDLFKRLIEARDKISTERGCYKVSYFAEKIEICVGIDEHYKTNPFNFKNEKDIDKFIKANNKYLYTFFTM